MKLRKDERGNVALIAVMLVVGLVIGFAVGRVMENKTTTSSSTKASAPMAATKAGDLRAALVQLAVEHQELTAQAVDSTLDGAANSGAVTNALIANGNAIGADVASVYGADAGKQFDALWLIHLQQFVAYAGASAKGDTAGKATALSNIDSQYTKPLAAFLAKATNLPEATVETLLRDHVTQTAAIIDDHVAKDYAKEMTDLAAANTHVASIFSALANAIVVQNPSKF